MGSSEFLATAFNVPTTDFLSFVFDTSEVVDRTKPLYIDAQDPSRNLNFTQTKTLVRKLISGLKSHGLEQGDCVVVVLANSFLYSSIFFSVIGAGGVHFGVNPACQPFEIEHTLRLAEPKFIVTSSDVLPTVLRASESLAYALEQFIVVDHSSFPLSAADRLPASPPRSHSGTPVDEKPTQYTNFTSLTHYGESNWLRISDEATQKSTPGALFSTSGTSGLPKAAILSHYALISQHLSMALSTPYETVRLISLPLFHAFAALFAHIFPARLGQPLYILPRFQMEQFANAVQKFKITDTVLAPPIVHAFNKSTLHLRELFDSLRWIGVGGAPIAADALEQFQTHLRATTSLSQVWGTTEIGWATCLPFPEQDCGGSIGRPLPGYEMRLVDSFGGVIVSENEPGELQVRSLGLMMGYKGQAAYEEGAWYATGDIMSRCDGKYTVVGRSKELIKVNGWQVAPAELEAVLLTHPCVADAGVIGVLRDDGVTEMPRAYIVRKSDEDGRCSTTAPEEIFEFTRARLASYKALDGGIFFVDFIPRTASGKIQRFKLAQMDNYRRSVTELLVQNNKMVAERKRGAITDLKAVAEARRTVPPRRSSRVATSFQTDLSGPVSLTGAAKNSRITHSRRRSRTSLVDKLKALEASCIVLDTGGTSLSPTV